MSYQFSFEEWQGIANKIAKVGIGAFLATPTTTDVNGTYTRLLGTFTNVQIEGFEFDVPSGKLKYNPIDGVNRTLKLIYSGDVSCPSNNDEVTIGIELTRDSVESIVTGTETTVKCRTNSTPYTFSKVFPLDVEVGDLIEIQIKGDATFTATMIEFATTMTKFY